VVKDDDPARCDQSKPPSRHHLSRKSRRFALDPSVCKMVGLGVPGSSTDGDEFDVFTDPNIIDSNIVDPSIAVPPVVED